MADCNDFWKIAELPYYEAEDAIAKLPSELPVQCQKEKWGVRWDKNGYMHFTDHLAALRITLDREPSWLEVHTSWHSGAGNIDAARKKTGYDVTGKPTGWDGWNLKQRQYAALVQINGVNKGSKIFDGKLKDPTPTKTAELMSAWSGKEVEPLPNPKPAPEQPKAEPTKAEKDPLERDAEELTELFFNKPGSLANSMNNGLKGFALSLSGKPTKRLVFLFFKAWLQFYREVTA